MLKFSNLRVPASIGPDGLTDYIAAMLGAPADDITSLSILRRSVDARRKSDICFVYTVVLSVKGEEGLLRDCRCLAEPYVMPAVYEFPHRGLQSMTPPVVVGMGPAGLFAALCLAEAGLKPVILERGKRVEARAADVEHFWKTGGLDEQSNVQFGEGGAGTFSDGKLTTGIGDQRIPFVLRRFAEFGAPEDILFLAKPHIGTDRLRHVVKAMRNHLLTLDCDIRFGHRLAEVHFASGRLMSADVETSSGTYAIDAQRLILAPGGGARDTFRMLDRAGVRLSAKSFSVGVRIEHLQKNIDLSQYGQAAALGTLPASDYKLAVHLASGRSVYTFCVCPGGRVIASSSEAGGVVTNGMSEYSRDGQNCNGGLLVTVTPDDFKTAYNASAGDTGPLGGIHFQAALEKSAFEHGGGNYDAPAQRIGDFLARRPTVGAVSPTVGAVMPTYKPGVRWCNLWDVLPPFVCDALAEALPSLEKNIRGFSDPNAVITAVETRSSSPVRIDREDYRAVGLGGLYPCGEGAGYAGGIMSAAVDGIRAAEALCTDLCNF